jgi:hypothetical protein
MDRKYKIKKLKISIIWIYKDENPEIAWNLIQEVTG